jgi:hypothetical protein
MSQSVEVAQLDLRYENFRMKNPVLEGKLLASIQQRGIEEPLLGVDPGPERILLDGFKRLRCAMVLGLHALPYAARGQDPALGIVSLLKGNPQQPLTILEQACFIDELRSVHGLSLCEIAQKMSRSKGWISMRLGLFGEMTPAVREKLFSGQFPAYAYLYTLRPFMRMNRSEAGRIEAFVLALSGKGLSVREIAFLFAACFQGSESLREQILQGRWELLLREAQDSRGACSGCNAVEASLLRDLERTEKHMRRVAALGDCPRLKSPAFLAQAGLSSARVLQQAGPFLKTVRSLHARCEQT